MQHQPGCGQFGLARWRGPDAEQLRTEHAIQAAVGGLRRRLRQPERGQEDHGQGG
ncbi:hypothetical protein [Candidatus Amarolinea dominans]|uniref:hypothetical protein n=1 Tax=Candidatus Amarolinea dominans TaxID=3140696 RepID=UPI001D8D9314|nr:hypothetical protein [Anaerolineae bacterium]